jgi:hypothetical protein
MKFELFEEVIYKNKKFKVICYGENNMYLISDWYRIIHTHESNLSKSGGSRV